MAGRASRRPKVVVAYPGVRPRLNEAVRGFAERGMLERFETTLAYRPEVLPDRMLSAGARLLFGDKIERELRRRSVAELAGLHVRRSPMWDAVRVTAQRLGAGAVVADRIWQRQMRAFDAGVAGRLRSGTDLVYGFEHGCLRTFARARELGIATVFDMSSPHRALWRSIEAAEIERRPELRTPYWDATEATAERRSAHERAELDLADLIIANSRFTADSATREGYPAHRVRIVPLGAPPVNPAWREIPATDRVTVLFVGSVSVRKGAHLLLDAWRALRPPASAELLIIGGWHLPESMRGSLPPGVRLVGSMPRDELYQHYARASVLAFPSLGDGFAMVVTEALAHGLPVITTSNTGAADLLDEGQSGWVLPSGDVAALVERMQWCLEHPAELRAMREMAEAAARRRPWSAYRDDLVDAVCSHLSAA